MQEDMFVNEDNNYIDDEDDIGASPINLPDPSLFSDYHDNDMGDHPDIYSEIDRGRMHAPD